MDIAGRILDVHDDPDVSLLKQAAQEGVDIPKFVLEADRNRPLGDLPDSLYALVDYTRRGPLKKWACNTKANTWLSGLYFLRQGSALSEELQQKVAHRLVGFYKLHQMRPPILLTKIAGKEATVPPVLQIEKVAEEHWALLSGGEKAYPIETWEQVKMAEEYFIERACKMSPSQKREFSCRLATRVRELSRTPHKKLAGIRDEDVQTYARRFLEARAQDFDPTRLLDEALQKYASEKGIDDEAFRVSIQTRIQLMEKKADAHDFNDNPKGRDWALGVRKLYHALWENRGSFPLDKLASSLEKIDRMGGVDALWGKRIPDPYASFLKIAEESDDKVMFGVGSHAVTARMLKKLSSHPEVLEKSYDKYFTQDFAADPITIFESMPDPDKKVLAAMASAL